MCSPIAVNNQICFCLGRSIRVHRIERIILIHGSTIDPRGGNMDKPLNFLAVLENRVGYGLGAEDVGFKKASVIIYGSDHMDLRRKVDDRIPLSNSDPGPSRNPAHHPK